MKRFLSLIITSVIMTNINGQINHQSPVNDFDMLEGKWQGSLTYLDYSSGKPYTMAADIDIKRIGKTNKFIFTNNYPNEKNANSIDTVVISKDGKFIGKELVKSRNILPNGFIEIVAEESGLDGNDNKRAIIRHTYTFGEKNFTNRKDVQFVGGTEWINRHEYSYNRKPSSVP